MARIVRRDGVVEDHREWQPDELNLTVKRVCRECNNEWMSVLEGKARRLLRPMIKGHPSLMAEASQATVARWCAKTALMLGYAHGIDLTPQEDRWHLRTSDWPSDRFTVVIATHNYYGPLQGTSYCLRLKPEGIESDDFQGYAITFAIGSFAAQVVAQFEWEGGEIDHGEAIAIGAVIQLWPMINTLASWPPKYGLDGPALERLARLDS
jgi:hypothetical protein